MTDCILHPGGIATSTSRNFLYKSTLSSFDTRIP